MSEIGNRRLNAACGIVGTILLLLAPEAVKPLFVLTILGPLIQGPLVATVLVATGTASRRSTAFPGGTPSSDS
jgi:hypothetical protein